MDQTKWCQMGHREVLSTQLRLIFEATGRETEVAEWLDAYTVTRDRLRKEFVTLAMPLVSAARTLSTSNFLKAKENLQPLQLDKHASAFQIVEQAMAVVRELLEKHLIHRSQLSVAEAEQRVKIFSKMLLDELLGCSVVGNTHAEVVKELRSLGVVFQRVWTSAQELNVAKEGEDQPMEFCFILHQAIRDDDEVTMNLVIQVVDGINKSVLPRAGEISCTIPTNFTQRDCDWDLDKREEHRHMDDPYGCKLCFRGGGIARDPKYRVFLDVAKYIVPRCIWPRHLTIQLQKIS
ncbi:hypothetical protein CYMTET_12660 [Cymbomonas tetramitiformis]|uniref:Uncharacterized protein n=1 Tax=Cymbomonas tetramitiformis TaxID=36881 RepID=A0AAE0GK11_9CHLO|nr:hypothetical protein CYMTET_12660 [Cymbomonas tetramitiformis]